jgi:hypothetical protein
VWVVFRAEDAELVARRIVDAVRDCEDQIQRQAAPDSIEPRLVARKSAAGRLPLVERAAE